MQKLEYRSIQIGIPGAVRDHWIDEWIDSTEDVTEMARAMKRELDEDGNVDVETLVKSGLMPEEKVYAVEQEIIDRLEMDQTA